MIAKLLLSLLFIFGAVISQAQDDPFAGRSTTPGADVVSSKPNIPAKKESFTAKLERYKAEGFKVAVVLNAPDITSKGADPSSTSGTMGLITLEGSITTDKAVFQPLVDGFAEIMNKEFNTDVFEVVDLKNIPYKDGKWGKTDDWGVTKYKMVITYSITPMYEYAFFMDKYKGELTINLGVTGTEFVNEKKGVKMKFPIRVGNLGFYRSPAFESEADPNISKTEELHKLVNPPSGDALVAELQKLQDEYMPKFLEKRK